MSGLILTHAWLKAQAYQATRAQRGLDPARMESQRGPFDMPPVKGAAGKPAKPDATRDAASAETKAADQKTLGRAIQFHDRANRP